MLGGRAAEEHIFGEVTTGGANDFDQATRIARAMVLDYGMSDLGPVNLGPTTDVTDWGRAFSHDSQISQEWLAKIDNEVRRIVDVAYAKAMKIVKEKKSVLSKVGEELLKKESL